ncbi:hypothetical protein [Persephonella sp.]
MIRVSKVTYKTVNTWIKNKDNIMFRRKTKAYAKTVNSMNRALAMLSI